MWNQLWPINGRSNHYKSNYHFNRNEEEYSHKIKYLPSLSFYFRDKPKTESKVTEFKARASLPPLQPSQLNRECPIKEKSLKALEQMDKMMDEILVNDITSNMCPFSFGAKHHKTPTSSKSDGHICRANKYVNIILVLLAVLFKNLFNFFTEIQQKVQTQLRVVQNYQTVKAFQIIKRQRINAVPDIKMVDIVYILMHATLFEH